MTGSSNIARLAPAAGLTGTRTGTFDAELGEPGRYVRFLQFEHRNRVARAPFTVEVAR